MIDETRESCGSHLFSGFRLDEAPPVRVELDRRGPEEEVRNDVGHLWCRLIKRKLPDLHTSEGN